MAFFILIALLFCEGIGLFLFHFHLPYILALIPCALFIFHITREGNFSIDFSPSVLLLGCSTFLYAYSLFNSINKEASIKPILVFISIYLLYLYFSSYPIQEKQIRRGIYLLSILFIGGFIFFSINKASLSPFIIPQTEYQLVSPLYYPHNHLGDFLGLGVVVSFFYFFTTSRLIFLIPLVIFIPFILISFSTSAYVSIFLTCTVLIVFFCIKKNNNVKQIFFTLCFLFILMMVMFIGSIKESEQIPFFKMIQHSITKTFSFHPKDIGSNRITYFIQAVEGIKKSPLVGIGPDNFNILSQRLSLSNDDFTTDVHNIILEIGVEAGFPALLFFLAFIVSKIKHGIQNPTIFFFIFLYLLFNFQTDYTYKIYSLFALFICAASQIGNKSQEKTTIVGTCIFTGGALFLQVVIICMLTSLIFQKLGDPAKAILFNPFNRYAYYDLLKNAANSKNGILIGKYTNKLRDISPANMQSELEIVKAYQALGEPHQFLNSLEKAYNLHLTLPFSYMEHMYILTAKYRSQKQAEDFITLYSGRKQKAPYFIQNKNAVEELLNLCKKTYKKACDNIRK